MMHKDWHAGDGGTTHLPVQASSSNSECIATPITATRHRTKGAAHVQQSSSNAISTSGMHARAAIGYTEARHVAPLQDKFMTLLAVRQPDYFRLLTHAPNWAHMVPKFGCITTVVSWSVQPQPQNRPAPAAEPQVHNPAASEGIAPCSNTSTSFKASRRVVAFSVNGEAAASKHSSGTSLIACITGNRSRLQPSAHLQPPHTAFAATEDAARASEDTIAHLRCAAGTPGFYCWTHHQGYAASTRTPAPELQAQQHTDQQHSEQQHSLLYAAVPCHVMPCARAVLSPASGSHADLSASQPFLASCDVRMARGLDIAILSSGPGVIACPKQSIDSRVSMSGDTSEATDRVGRLCIMPEPAIEQQQEGIDIVLQPQQQQQQQRQAKKLLQHSQPMRADPKAAQPRKLMKQQQRAQQQRAGQALHPSQPQRSTQLIQPEVEQQDQQTCHHVTQGHTRQFIAEASQVASAVMAHHPALLVEQAGNHPAFVDIAECHEQQQHQQTAEGNRDSSDRIQQCAATETASVVDDAVPATLVAPCIPTADDQSQHRSRTSAATACNLAIEQLAGAEEHVCAGAVAVEAAGSEVVARASPECVAQPHVLPGWRPPHPLGGAPRVHQTGAQQHKNKHLQRFERMQLAASMAAASSAAAAAAADALRKAHAATAASRWATTGAVNLRPRLSEPLPMSVAGAPAVLQHLSKQPPARLKSAGCAVKRLNAASHGALRASHATMGALHGSLTSLAGPAPAASWLRAVPQRYAAQRFEAARMRAAQAHMELHGAHSIATTLPASIEL